MRRSSYNSVLCFASWLAVSTVAPLATAQDAVLTTVDELIAGGHCDAALALLDHAQGSAPSLAGRRGICEARLGRSADASGHIAQALRVPADPWVQAHRSELLAALSTGTATPPTTPATSTTPAAPATSTVPNVVPAVVPNVVPDAAPSPATPASPSHPPVTMSAEFVDHFARNPPADVPLPRISPRFDGGRFVVRVIGSVGTQLNLDTGHLGGKPWPVPVPLYGWSDKVMAPRFDLGVEADFAASRRLSLVTQLDVGVLSSNGQLSAGNDYYSYYSGYRNQLAWSPGVSFRWLMGARIAVGRQGRGIVGVGARLGLVRFHGTLDYTSPANGGGTVTGHYTHWDGGMTAELVIDTGVAIGRSRDIVLLVRNATGVPYWSGQVMVGIPFFRSR